MSNPQHKGKIKNVREHSGHYIYDRVVPGVTLPNEHLKGAALRAMSSEVKVYQVDDLNKDKKIG